MATKSNNPSTGSKETAEVHHNSAADLVLQWVTYAFWGWFVAAMVWLAAVTLNFFIAGNHADEWGSTLAYPLASVIVMLLCAGAADFFYSRREPAVKQGGASVIMLIHSVLFILLAVAALIVAVFSGIMMALNSDPTNGTDGPKVALFTSLVVCILYSALATRVLYGGRRRVVRLGFWVTAGVVALGFIIASFAGPAAEANRTKQDRLVETALPSLANDIQNYARKNDKLPASLKDVTYIKSSSAEGVQKIIDQGLVTYKPNTLPAKTGNFSLPGDGGEIIPMDDTASSTSTSGAAIKAPYNKTKRFYYQLCTTFTTEKKNEYNYQDTSPNVGYTTDLSAGVESDYRYNYVYSISEHPKGQVCYDLYADGKYSYDKPMY